MLLTLLHESWQRKAGMLGEPGRCWESLGDAGRAWELSRWMQCQSNSNGGAQHRDTVICPVISIKTLWSVKCLITLCSIPESLVIIRQKLLSKILFISIPSLIFKITRLFFWNFSLHRGNPSVLLVGHNFPSAAALMQIFINTHERNGASKILYWYNFP